MAAYLHSKQEGFQENGIYTGFICVCHCSSCLLYTSRKYNQVTDFGKFVDPLADKLLVASALILFVEQKAMAGWMVCVILARELIITSLRVVAANKGRVLAATWTGKVKTCVQIGGIIIIYLYYIFGWALFSGTTGLSFETGDSIAYTLFISSTGNTPLLLTIVGWVVTLVTIYSGYDYLKKNWALIKDGACLLYTSRCV